MSMVNTRMRVLHSHGMESEHLRATLKGLDRFREFGAFFDVKDITCKGAIRGVKCGEFIRHTVTAPQTRVTSSLEFRPGFLDGFNDTIGIGVTNRPLQNFDVITAQPYSTAGVGKFKTGAVISVAWTRGITAELVLAGLELIAAHEVGHLFIRSKSHCTDSECIMRESEGMLRLMRRLSQCSRFDFCGSCREEIAANAKFSN